MVDTGFHVDHTQLGTMLEGSRRNNRPWALGKNLDEGVEWFACTFGDQPPVDVAEDRLEHLLESSDQSWIEAYSRMTLDENHSWHRHAASEVEYVVEHSGGPPNRSLDVGCGTGRHALELARRGSTVVALDIVPQLIEKARAENRDDRIQYLIHDMRSRQDLGEFDLVMALYDVIGSSARVEDDQVLVRNMAAATKPGGTLVVSVMNSEPLLASETAILKANDKTDFARKLELLRPSNLMERTGGVFDPDYLLYFDGIFYRKEQFHQPGEYLPSEMVVRDRRFDAFEITQLLEQNGLLVETVVPVRAGRWKQDPPLSANDPQAKELLVFATRR